MLYGIEINNHGCIRKFVTKNYQKDTTELGGEVAAAVLSLRRGTPVSFTNDYNKTIFVYPMKYYNEAYVAIDEKSGDVVEYSEFRRPIEKKTRMKKGLRFEVWKV